MSGDPMRFVRPNAKAGLPSNGFDQEPEVIRVGPISQEGLKVLQANKIANARERGEIPYPWWVRVVHWARRT